jgi:DNA-binding winged helix-turn-helix (wHTH) protein/TolB-like protein/Tfp pilus assembly protein PilF
VTPRPESVLRIGDLRVDPALDEICKDGSIVKVEPRTMRLLLCLAEHAGQVVSVDQLLAEVWKDVIVGPDSVYQAVAGLRRILGDDPKDPVYIANVMRRGYRLVAPVAPWSDSVGRRVTVALDEVEGCREKQSRMQPKLTQDNGTAPPRFRIGDLEVDIGKAEVKRGEETIALPKLSFDLLCALINAAPAIVTNEDLLQQVWPGVLVSPESVSQRVKLLRSAIDDDSQQPRYILGVRGRGYRLIPAVERLGDSNLPTNGDATNAPISAPSATIPGEPASHSFALKRSNGRPKWVVIAAAVLVAIGAVIVLGLHYRSSSHYASQPDGVVMLDKSIAVLPFSDMSEKRDQEYFGDAMAEEIIDLLVKSPALKVIGRTSSFQFKGKTEDLRSIGKQLGAAYVLEGSVRKSGDRLRVTAQLIDSRNGTPRWSQTYDRDFGDVLKLQDEIAAKVAREVTADAFFSELVSRKTLRNPEAYTAFLHGVHAVERADQQGIEQAVSDFQRALDLDPAFADAAGALAASYQSLGSFGFMPPAEAFKKGRLAAELALKLDPNQSDAHAALGNIHIFYDWDWSAAEREFKLARAETTQDSNVWQFDPPQLALAMGRSDDALKSLNDSLALDPLDPSNYFWLGITQLRRGRLAEAEAAMRRTVELSPTYTFAHYGIALVLLARSEPDAALAEFLKESSEPVRLVGSALAYFALGRKADSDAALAQMLKNYTPYSPSGIATVYAFRGESDEAFTWLDRAYAQKDPLLYRIKFATEFDRLHSDPRYKAFLGKMNLPE